MKLSERTSIPILWVFCAYIPTTSFVVAVALWVFNVDARLHRIEDKLGILSIAAKTHGVDLISEAKAHP